MNVAATMFNISNVQQDRTFFILNVATKIFSDSNVLQDQISFLTTENGCSFFQLGNNWFSRSAIRISTRITISITIAVAIAHGRINRER